MVYWLYRVWTDIYCMLEHPYIHVWGNAHSFRNPLEISWFHPFIIYKLLLNLSVLGLCLRINDHWFVRLAESDCFVFELIYYPVFRKPTWSHQCHVIWLINCGNELSWYFSDNTWNMHWTAIVASSSCDVRFKGGQYNIFWLICKSTNNRMLLYMILDLANSIWQPGKR